MFGETSCMCITYVYEQNKKFRYAQISKPASYTAKYTRIKSIKSEQKLYKQKIPICDERSNIVYATDTS